MTSQQENIYVGKDLLRGIYQLRMPFLVQQAQGGDDASGVHCRKSSVIAPGEYTASCGYTAAYAAWVLARTLDQKPRASHQELFAALGTANSEWFLACAVARMQRLPSRATYSPAGQLAKSLKMHEIEYVLDATCFSLRENFVFCDGNARFGYAGPTIELWIGLRCRQRFNYVRGSTIMASVIQEVANNVRKYVVVIIPESMPRGWHWMVVVIRNMRQGKVEFIALDGVNGLVTPEVRCWDVVNRSIPVSSVKWMYDSWLRYG